MRSRLLFVLLFIVSGATALAADQRVPWTSSRIIGSPEPPLPFIHQQAVHELTFKDATELEFIPNSNWALILTREAELHGVELSNPDRSIWIADLKSRIGRGGESYSLAFDPGFETNRFVYLAMYSRQSGEPRVCVSRFELREGSPPVLNLNSELRIIEWESAGHNGCDLQFGPDGMLFISSGDAEVPAPPDRRRTGQSLDDLLACLLRIDVSNATSDEPYRIPDDNPFVEMPDARPEIWAYGFRNPWKIHVDPRDGAVWVADVGWELWEMVFRIDEPGFNGGWSIVEGPQSIHPDWPRGPTPIGTPVKVHPHTESTSITGGRIYRGRRHPSLKDAYVYGDWGTGRIWALWMENGAITQHREIASTPHQIICFAEDNAGELYYLNYGDGAVYELVPNPETDANRSFPRKLSETGLFASVSGHRLAPGVQSFDIVAPMWSDGAMAEYAVAFPGLEKAQWRGVDFACPTNAVLLKTLSLEMTAGDPGSRRRIESQLLHFDGRMWRGYSYQWNTNQTDAELVEASGKVETLLVQDDRFDEGLREKRWRFHSRDECIRCHMVRFDVVHGNLNAFAPGQLAVASSTAKEKNQLIDLITAGWIEQPGRAPGQHPLVNPHDESKLVDQRARSWLHANCAHCHRPDAAGAVTMYWPIDYSLERTGSIGVPPARGEFGIKDAAIIQPGYPEKSSLLFRILTLGSGRMPMIGSHEVDRRGAELIRDWIVSMKPETEANLDSETPIASTEQGIAGVFQAMHSREERQRLINAGLGSTNAFVRDLFRQFQPPDERESMLGAGFDPAMVLALGGRMEKGRELFFAADGPQCFTCHQIDGKGKMFGPDLINVGGRYNRQELLRQLISPNAEVPVDWRAVTIETVDDAVHTGFLVDEDEATVRLRTALDPMVSVPKNDIIHRSISDRSLMPEGLLDYLTAQQAADLLAFLESLK